LEAQKQGWFKEEIVPVTVESKGKAHRLKNGDILHRYSTEFGWT
jgi:acetyl-CoA acetyltransferase